VVVEKAPGERSGSGGACPQQRLGTLTLGWNYTVVATTNERIRDMYLGWEFWAV
jgi:hypothetical protein